MNDLIEKDLPTIHFEYKQALKSGLFDFQIARESVNTTGIGMLDLVLKYIEYKH